MSFQNLTLPNDYNLYCGTLNVAGESSDTRTFVAQMAGPYASAQNCNIYCSKVGKCATLTFSQLFSASTSASLITSNNFLPSNYFPAGTAVIVQPIYVYNNALSVGVGPIVAGTVTLSGTGGITIAVSLGSSFAATNNCGFVSFSMAYTTV